MFTKAASIKAYSIRRAVSARREWAVKSSKIIAASACFLVLLALHSQAAALTNARRVSLAGWGSNVAPEASDVSPPYRSTLLQALEGKTVLLVGDSMAEGIGPWLQQKVMAAGGRFVSRFNRSSTISWWASGPLQSALARHQPDIVFIALGSNEIFMARPQTAAPFIWRIVAQLGSRSAFWVGPPCWEPDHGLVGVIEANFMSGRFYNSNSLRVTRARDGKHPTAQGYQHWVNLIWAWSSGRL